MYNVSTLPSSSLPWPFRSSLYSTFPLNLLNPYLTFPLPYQSSQIPSQPSLPLLSSFLPISFSIYLPPYPSRSLPISFPTYLLPYLSPSLPISIHTCPLPSLHPPCLSPFPTLPILPLLLFSYKFFFPFSFNFPPPFSLYSFTFLFPFLIPFPSPFPSHLHSNSVIIHY